MNSGENRSSRGHRDPLELLPVSLVARSADRRGGETEIRTDPRIISFALQIAGQKNKASSRS